MSKPLVIQLREAKATIVESINTALREGIPCYLIEPILNELHSQVRDSAQAEYEQAKRQLDEEEAKKREEEAKKQLAKQEAESESEDNG